MTQELSSGPSIVLGVASDVPHHEAQRWATERARAGGTLHVVVVDPDDGGVDADDVVERIRAACPDVSVSASRRTGSVVPELVAAAEEDDLLVVGSFRGKRGSTAGYRVERLAERATIPVVVVPDPARAIEGDVVLAVDEPLDERAVQLAVDEARRRRRRLTALRAWEMPVITRTGLTDFAEDPLRWRRINAELLDRATAQIAARFPDVRVHPLLVEGHPARAIVDHTRLASLVVLGQGHAHVLSGSILREVVRESQVPVCVVPLAANRPARAEDETVEQPIEFDERAS
ncbi:universal stress protein [Curtobacterium ammoniigenes]|uniref:universal stress protein n=1 Tax=Curtobacterium ammoniigenes TaxID=395387 RepID=UPI00082F658C|nr:universal stress protein [Curtobacterium ammoniigenes]